MYILGQWIEDGSDILDCAARISGHPSIGVQDVGGWVYSSHLIPEAQTEQN